MAKLGKMHVKPGKQATSKMDLSQSHITTLDFGQIMPLYHLACVPGDKISVNANIFARCAPLNVPTYGKADLKMAAYFVPYYQIADDFEAWVSGQSVKDGKATKLRFFYGQNIYDILSHSECATNIPEKIQDPTTHQLVDNPAYKVYDFVYVDQEEGDEFHYRFTPYGKFCYKIFRSLGYQLPSNVGNNRSTINRKLNAMPFIAFCKAYHDWMSQSTRYNTTQLAKVLQVIKSVDVVNDPQLGYYSNGQITTQMMSIMLKSIRLCFDNDYFTSAWAQPNGPVDSMALDTSSEVLSRYDRATNDMVSDDDGVYLLPAEASGDEFLVNVGARQLDTLRKFDAWVRRNNYSGSKDVDKIYSRFGIKPEDFRSTYSHLIGTGSTNLTVGDVTSTAATETSQLGDYAGKGIVSGGDKFKYNCEDYGELIIMSWLSVRPVYHTGVEREVLKTERFDFFQPELDGVGGNAIYLDEVTSDPRSTDNVNGDNAFGFNERYNEYKFGRDQVTGDMCLGQYADGFQDSWFFARDLNSLRENYALRAQNENFLTYDQVNTEFDNIFTTTTEDLPDHFYVTAYFDVNAVRPMKSLNQVIDLGEGDVSMEKNGNTIN